MIFCNFFIKAYDLSTPENHVNEAILINTYNFACEEKLMKIIMVFLSNIIIFRYIIVA